ncbi:unnamed protein product [Rotaria sordida]|uniref:Cyclic nucleotide-binding domain-containing protein n=1 Tax=Rotaria sordida TaxID=392033 RepID=A0A814R541_9BILA|nr:unnamed protein product [Rotaria sordida]
MQFDCIDWINNQTNKLLFDHIFLTIELTLAFHSARTRMDNIQKQFPELANIDERIWHEVCQETHFYHLTASYILLDLQHPTNQRVFTAYLIVRGIVECKMDTMPIYYRSGNIVGIDALFSQNVTEHGTYFVSRGLLEAYSIDAGLLDQFLNDENLAPSIYREITLHLLSNKYQARLKLNRLQLRLLVHERAKFYWKQSEVSIQLKENQRLFILAGNVIHLLNDEILLNPSTVAYSWTDDDEEFCIKDTNLSVHFPLQTSGLLSTELLYPGYSGETTQFIERQFSASLSDDVIDSIDV